MGRTCCVALAVLITAAGVFAATQFLDFYKSHTVNLPSYPPTQNTVWLEQNWNIDQRDWYHHASQGTVTLGIPYEWFIASEQPELSLTEAGLLKDPAYLDRLGFIPPDASGKSSNGLPVGFSRGDAMVDPTTGEHWINPQTGKDTTAIGLTCAACHTGRLTYKGTAIMIDGGGAMIDLTKLRTAVGLSLGLTQFSSLRFDRFVKRLLGDKASAEAKAATQKKLDEVVAEIKKIQKLDHSVAAESRDEGFGRLDALTRIGNQVFGLDLDIVSNYAAYTAPVRYPHIWDTSWFDWVQYNSSIEQPMVRNAGEALGVRALTNLVKDTPPLFTATADIKSLFDIESLIAGQQPRAKTGFTGLKAPAWPTDVLPPIDQQLAARGAPLYDALCKPCHLAPVNSPNFYDSANWSPFNATGQSYLTLKVIDLEKIGTDPAQAEDMKNRKVLSPIALGLSSNEFGRALGDLVKKTVDRWYDSQTPPTPESKRKEMNGYRDNGIRALLAYKARPLDGIWATAPYLHNGSVPTLYALLSPVKERPVKFTLGHREFDPVNVGIRYDDLSGGTTIDTSLRGNYNRGHAFDDTPGTPGAIGHTLSVNDRRALIEYLKTL